MEKKGKFDLLSVLIASILIFVLYAVLVLGGLGTVIQNFPVNQTNASLTAGTADSTLPSMKGFNGSSDTLFQCNVSTNASGRADNPLNLSNVSILFKRALVEHERQLTEMRL